MLIREVKICCNDLDRTETFYAETFELKLLRKNGSEISFSAGTSILTFSKNLSINRPVYHFAFNIPHNQISECLEWLKPKAEIIPVEEQEIADFTNWNAHSIYTYDNNRNIVEWIARHDLNNESTKPFSGSSAECISEIGWVSDNVPEAAKQISSTYGVPVYAKQPPQAKFTALGDDQGLLILSEIGRNWYPTSIAANRFPLKVIMETPSGTNALLID